MHLLKWLALFLILNIVSGSYESPYQQRRFLPAAKQRVPEHDNEYVWFTRDVHEDDTDKNIQRNLFLKKWSQIFRRKTLDQS